MHPNHLIVAGFAFLYLWFESPLNFVTELSVFACVGACFFVVALGFTAPKILLSLVFQVLFRGASIVDALVYAGVPAVVPLLQRLVYAVFGVLAACLNVLRFGFGIVRALYKVVSFCLRFA